jgi:SAM-dependent methyltransferase
MAGALYDQIGRGYAAHRRADARIAARILDALGTARTVLNVGAGAGSYEPADRRVAAVEPAETMLRQRPAGSAPAVRGVAEALPFRDGAFDAALASLTIHHWTDWRAGLMEMRRVARGRVVIFTWDPSSFGFWLVRDYFPEIAEFDAAFPPFDALAEVLGPLEVRTVPVPADCTDGFLAAYWRRPAAYLDPALRGAISAFARIPDAASRLERLAADLADGSWERRNGNLLALPELDVGYRILIARADHDPPA